MTRDDALQLIVPLKDEDKKLLLKTLCEEMDTDDLEEVLADQGWVAE